MRFILIVRSVYAFIASSITDLTIAGTDVHDADEVVYVGDSTCLQGLGEHVLTTLDFRENVYTPFGRGIVIEVADPTTILARGCVVQAALVAEIAGDEPHREPREAYQHMKVGGNTGRRPPTWSHGTLGATWALVLHKETSPLCVASNMIRFGARRVERER